MMEKSGQGHVFEINVTGSVAETPPAPLRTPARPMDGGCESVDRDEVSAAWATRWPIARSRAHPANARTKARDWASA
jgi:hypothetical protein